MGGNKASFNTNRTSFVPENSDALDYQRTGGCFVTTKKAIFLVILALLALILVGLLIYFYGTRTTTVTHVRSSDLEKLLTDSINEAKEGKEAHLPPTLQPLHYRLRIHPYLQENNPNNFTFQGRVTITMHCLKMTKKIILNVEDLEIFTKEVSVVSTKSIRVKRALPEDENTTAADSQANSTTEVPTAIPTSVVDNRTTTTTTTAAMPTTLPPSTTTTAPSPTLPEVTTHQTTAAASATTTTTSTKATTTTTTTTTQAPPPQIDGVHTSEKVVSMTIQNQEIDKTSSRYVINLDDLLHSGVNYTLDIKFSGKIENDLAGLYRTSYIGPQGRKRWILATQLFPNFARRVFPCFDEPFFKSSFEISIARRTNMTALSNMPLRESEVITDQKGWVWDHFEKSPPMSPHLVAFAVCDYQNLKPSTNLGTVFKIWAPDLSITNAEYAMAVGPKILETLQDYFGVKYPLSKIDFVVAPELSKPATEGWGLIFFRDNALLLDPNSNSSKTRNHIFKTIAQKLTTQWFGNLVTMNFTDAWLNRGLSTYMEDVVEDIIEPELEDVDPFALRVTQAILDSDKLKSVKSLSDDVKNPRNIRADDGNKGSCLIGMLNFTLSEAVFKNGLKNYLQKWKYQISNQNSLWDSFTEASKNLSVIPPDLSIHTVMDSWIEQEGYPMVTVVRNYTTGNAIINQTRFVHEKENDDNVWYIPLTYTRETDGGEISTFWLKKEKSISTLNFTQPGNTTWVIFNVDQAGFYRVNYDYINWKLLQTQLMSDPEKISPANRAQLLNDAFELATIGVLHYRVPFELTKYLGPKERHYVPWNAVYNSLQNLANHIGRTQYNGIFQQYVINLIKPLHDELGYAHKPEDSQKKQILRSFVVKAACENYYEPCLKWAKELYQQWMSSPDPDKSNPIDFDFRKTVSCTAIKMGGEREWNFLWQRTQKPSMSAANLKIAYLSLGCTREPWLITRYLELSLNRSISAQNTPYVWKSITHPVGLATGLTFIRMHWNRIYKSYEHNFSGMKSIFEDFLSNLSTETDLEDLAELYENHKDNLNFLSSSLLAVVDRIKWRMNWSQSHMPTVSMWLQRNI